MTAQALTNEEIDAILYYADNYAPPDACTVSGWRNSSYAWCW